MRTFKQFVTLCEKAYDKEMGQTIKKIGTGVKVGAERKKTAPEKRRMKAAGGGKMVPAKDYKARKDIGQQRKAETRVQQPTKERGSAKLDPRAAQRKAAMERRARKAGAKTPTASQLLTKKTKPKVSPDYKPQKASGMTRDERRKIKRAGQRLVKDMQYVDYTEKLKQELDKIGTYNKQKKEENDDELTKKVQQLNLFDGEI